MPSGAEPGRRDPAGRGCGGESTLRGPRALDLGTRALPARPAPLAIRPPRAEEPFGVRAQSPFLPGGRSRSPPRWRCCRGYRRGAWPGKRPVDPHPSLTCPHPPGTQSPRSPRRALQPAWSPVAERVSPVRRPGGQGFLQQHRTFSSREQPLPFGRERALYLLHKKRFFFFFLQLLCHLVQST